MRGGRPLRFLGLVIGGWVTLRTIALWPPAPAPVAPVRSAGPVRALAPAVAMPPIVSPRRVPRLRGATRPRRPPVAMRGWGPATQAPGMPVVSVAAPPPPAPPPPAPPSPAPPSPAPPSPAPPPGVADGSRRQRPRAAPRWHGSAWLIARGGATGARYGGQLGGSQAGTRVTYTLDRPARLAVAARLSGALGGRDTEFALGLDWQPTRAPIHLIAEHRVALDRGRGGPALMLVGGLGPRRLGAGVVATGYAQVGVIARDGIERFADGALRLSHPLATHRMVQIDIGLAAWGGAQRGAARADLGPSLGVAVPVGGKNLRLTADWRRRVAGDAAPGSGPALTIGTDF